MARAKNTTISARKQPQQVRSARLVGDILEAAARVLARDGAHRFTTARVAEATGISVGSLYQYFPNKQAILFRLQTEEWTQTMGQLRRILGDSAMTPRERIRQAIQAFFRSECEEAAFRGALEDSAPLYREAAESQAHAQEGRQLMLSFMKDALPHASPRERRFAADLVGLIMSSTGKAISTQNRSRTEVNQFADAVGGMLCAWLDSIRPIRTP
jgi:AcrR family transcriptional regulator